MLIVAALEEELKIALDFFGSAERIPTPSVRIWQVSRGEQKIFFLKTGIGPKRAAAALEDALKIIRPSRILAIGYAGALDPELRLGNLVAVDRALSFLMDKSHPGWEFGRVESTFGLNDCGAMLETAKATGIPASAGAALTSAHVLGNPAYKSLLHKNFGVSVIDMETAAWARIAAQRSIPLSCIRVISDEAADTFLAPFSYDPALGLPARARQFVSTGVVDTYREWKEHTSVAQVSLRRFLAHWLKCADFIGFL